MDDLGGKDGQLRTFWGFFLIEMLYDSMKRIHLNLNHEQRMTLLRRQVDLNARTQREQQHRSQIAILIVSTRLNGASNMYGWWIQVHPPL